LLTDNITMYLNIFQMLCNFCIIQVVCLLSSEHTISVIATTSTTTTIRPCLYEECNELTVSELRHANNQLKRVIENQHRLIQIQAELASDSIRYFSGIHSLSKTSDAPSDQSRSNESILVSDPTEMVISEIHDLRVSVDNYREILTVVAWISAVSAVLYFIVRFFKFTAGAAYLLSVVTTTCCRRCMPSPDSEVELEETSVLQNH
jgi:hypothetical protein